ncbi:MAG: 2-amino-4-hydroxy-6-hydroxymethyldihydropteridine diphosphokinase [Eubacteriaceae bacterium]|jgi:dihydroneopterin aldolase/2-amino-4-hydroxy-6-hydroxymethyldihydropteridine diphosphokinase|nr:2-amino-4-hydroxy-6-hydroxymethyldihydropteridine diphosphokinase [Eubacteriaceae bacterium]
MDTINIKKLCIHAHHGVFQEEKNLGQRFYLNITLSLSTRIAATTGDLNASVHYGELAHEIQEVFTQESYDLIETAAEKVATYILTHYPLVKKVWIEVEKPWAPVGLPLGTVSVAIERRWHRVFIGYGSNMGDRQALIDQALKLIDEDEDIQTVKQSSTIETPPWGVEEQDPFLNGVVEIKTLKSPLELLDFLQSIELQLHRKRTLHWGPRTIDLDILFYDELVMDSPRLNLPHPYIAERLFVLEPLKEIAPHLVHPVYRKNIRELLKDIQ